MVLMISRSSGFSPSSPIPARISPTQSRSNPGSTVTSAKYNQFHLGKSALLESDEIYHSNRQERIMGKIH